MITFRFCSYFKHKLIVHCVLSQAVPYTKLPRMLHCMIKAACSFSLQSWTYIVVLICVQSNKTQGTIHTKLPLHYQQCILVETRYYLQLPNAQSNSVRKNSYIVNIVSRHVITLADIIWLKYLPSVQHAMPLCCDCLLSRPHLHYEVL